VSVVSSTARYQVPPPEPKDGRPKEAWAPEPSIFEQHVLDAKETLELEAKMKAWYQANVSRWLEHLFQSATLAAPLALKLRSGEVRPPPLHPGMPAQFQPTAASNISADEVAAILPVLDGCVALKDMASQAFEHVMQWPGKSTPGRGRPRGVAEDHIEEWLSQEAQRAKAPGTRTRPFVDLLAEAPGRAAAEVATAGEEQDNAAAEQARLDVAAAVVKRRGRPAADARERARAATTRAAAGGPPAAAAAAKAAAVAAEAEATAAEATRDDNERWIPKTVEGLSKRDIKTVIDAATRRETARTDDALARRTRARRSPKK